MDLPGGVSQLLFPSAPPPPPSTSAPASSSFAQPAAPSLEARLPGTVHLYSNGLGGEKLQLAWMREQLPRATPKLLPTVLRCEDDSLARPMFVDFGLHFPVDPAEREVHDGTRKLPTAASSGPTAMDVAVDPTTPCHSGASRRYVEEIGVEVLHVLQGVTSGRIEHAQVPRLPVLPPGLPTLGRDDWAELLDHGGILASTPACALAFLLQLLPRGKSMEALGEAVLLCSISRLLLHMAPKASVSPPSSSSSSMSASASAASGAVVLGADLEHLLAVAFECAAVASLSPPRFRRFMAALGWSKQHPVLGADAEMLLTTTYYLRRGDAL